MNLFKKAVVRLAPTHPLARPNASRRPYYDAPNLNVHGHKPVEWRLRGLDALLDYVKDAHILDVGCAEGVVVDYLLRGQPASAQGVDNSAVRIELARSAHVDPRLRFDVLDLNDPDCLQADCLRPDYDMMTFLLVYQHLMPALRARQLTRLLARCRRHVVLNAAARHADDEAREVIEASGFALCRTIPTRGHQSLQLFERVVG